MNNSNRSVINTILIPLSLTICSVSVCFSQTQREQEQKVRDSINAEFIKNYSDCSYCNKNGITNFNKKTEFWKICELQNGNKIIQIESHSESTYFQEIYFEKNRKLLYARETQNYTPINSFEQIQWSCEFYINNNKVITTISLGHGKTENEEWDENSIIAMYTKRVKEIEKIQN